MLRVLLVLLILANGLFWAWRGGWLSAVGMAPVSQREPHRLQQQVAADVLRVLPAGSAAPRSSPGTPAPARPSPASEPSASAPAVGSTSGVSAACMQTPPLNSAAADAAEVALARALPSKPWQRVSDAAQASPFVVAMTGLSGAAVQLKQRELERLSINPEPLTTPGGAVGGLILGRYADQVQANNALAAFTKRGVRTARVVNLADASSATVRLRIDPVSDDVAGILRGWNAQATESTTFRACGNA